MNKAAPSTKKKPSSTQQEFQNGTGVTYTTPQGEQRTCRILCYVPAGATLEEYVDKVGLTTGERADLGRDVSLEGHGPKYLVCVDAEGKKRGRFFYPSAGTVNRGVLATK